MLLGSGLRSKETESEKRLWQKLRANRIGAKFRRQIDIGTYTSYHQDEDMTARELDILKVWDIE